MNRQTQYIRDLVFELTVTPKDEPRYAQIERQLQEIYRGMPKWKFRTLIAAYKAASYVAFVFSVFLFTLGLDEWRQRLFDRFRRP
jgi:hypothetical protein